MVPHELGQHHESPGRRLPRRRTDLHVPDRGRRRGADRRRRQRLVNGDFPLQEGIDLVFAPGHTDGHQAVAVNTARGRAIIFGDALYMYAGMAKRFPGKFLEVVTKAGVAGKKLDLEDPKVRAVVDKVMNARYGGYLGPAILNVGHIMRTLNKLDMMADIVIPGHDAELLKMKLIPDDYAIE